MGLLRQIDQSSGKATRNTNYSDTSGKIVFINDLAGVVEAIGSGISGFQIGEEVYVVTNEQFTGAYAEYALTSAGMMARKPEVLGFIEAASAPTV